MRADSFCTESADDAMAILMAFQSPELEIIGLTSVFGNVHATLATHNAIFLVNAHRPFSGCKLTEGLID